MNTFESALKTAQIHAYRLSYALERLDINSQ